MSPLEARLRDLEKNHAASLTASMNTEEALVYVSHLPAKQQAICLTRMTDEQLEAGIAYLHSMAAINEARTNPRAKKRP